MPQWRWAVKRARKKALRLLSDHRLRRALLSLCLIAIVIFAFATFGSKAESPQLASPTLFIAIGSAPHNFDLRNAARNSWLKWRSDPHVSYRFFSDKPPPAKEVDLDRRAHSLWHRLQKEARQTADLVLQPLPTGYGDKQHNAYARRARYQMKWALRMYPQVQFFLRIDDDSFLCLHKLMYELSSLPTTQFFWGRFWCTEGRNRADENFMLFSRDVVQLLVDERLVGGLIPFDEHVTLGWNVGYWSWVLNLTVFDDQARLDAQQGYLTDYMHDKKVAQKDKLTQFCERFIYAHHVRANVMKAVFEAAKTHLMYPLPLRKGPSETCPGSAQSFVPARHSSLLPDLRITRSANAPT